MLVLSFEKLEPEKFGIFQPPFTQIVAVGYPEDTAAQTFTDN